MRPVRDILGIHLKKDMRGVLFPEHILFQELFPRPYFREGGKKGGWVSNYPRQLEHMCYNMLAKIAFVNLAFS
jgi:hypothetical protein